jgi:hypothetical protein
LKAVFIIFPFLCANGSKSEPQEVHDRLKHKKIYEIIIQAKVSFVFLFAVPGQAIHPEKSLKSGEWFFVARATCRPLFSKI